MAEYYVEDYREPRERWLNGYFNWTDTEDITAAEQHTARDGFDAGANWMEQQLLHIFIAYIEPMGLSCVVPAKSRQDALERLRSWEYFDPASIQSITDDEISLRPIPVARIKVDSGLGIFTI